MKNLGASFFVERAVNGHDWVIYVLIFTLLTLVISKILFPNNFSRLRSPDDFQEVNENQMLINIIFTLNFSVLLSTLVCTYVTPAYEFIFYTPLLVVLALTAVLLLFFFARRLLAGGAAYAFGVSYDNNYNLKNFNYFRIFSVIILWLGVVAFYFTDLNKTAVLAVLVALLVLVRAAAFRKQFEEQSEKKMNIWYYNILYICTLEILPLLVIFKFLNIW